MLSSTIGNQTGYHFLRIVTNGIFFFVQHNGERNGLEHTKVFFFFVAHLNYICNFSKELIVMISSNIQISSVRPPSDATSSFSNKELRSDCTSQILCPQKRRLRDTRAKEKKKKGEN